ncbi:small acid-soluble spore protein K [Effusibacillus consociatus]|uniref:Small acid-soluble spore protein K n=1 Tax=Effusibacillus consociatus TaxID=1117041 RepID=A0ABV9PZD5_9BACL
MVRNKDSNFPGPRKIEDPKAKPELAPLRPDGTIAPQPRDRMRKSGKES